MASIRQERVSELIKRELSILFQRESTTWFGGLFITVTQVRIGPDLGLARVYLSFMAVADKEKALQTVETENWRVRKALGGMVGKQLRRVPELNFYLDDSLDFVDEVDQALKS
jgi:ribosome-binding factor A